MNNADISSRARVYYSNLSTQSCKQIDRMFAYLMLLQFAAGVLIALLVTPSTWQGHQQRIHVHVIATVVIGGLAAGMSVYMAWKHSGRALTRNIIGISQVVFSALFIHLSGGRIEAHFHVFGSLAFLSLYRDWKTLILPTVIIAADHLVRAILWPASIFGVLSPAPWRAFEHAGWVLFEIVFLIYGCVRATREMRSIADNQARLESMNHLIEHEVEQRTKELSEKTDELQAEIIERSMLQDQLIQAQKLESIGQLAAGIAHEINTPSQYVSDNTQFVKEQFGALLGVIDRYAEQIDPNAPAQSWNERVSEIKETLKRLDYDYVREEIPLALEQSLEGLQRITKIIGAMKDFSHPGTTEPVLSDLNRAIESTVTVCSNKWKHAADLELDLDDTMPDVPCLVAEFNQVILNMITNAVDAITQKHGSCKGNIRIATTHSGEWAVITVSDNGTGIPESVVSKMYDPFYTTKEVGKGTGQGLSISRDIVVNKHNGMISCESSGETGTTFTIKLPLSTEKQAKAVA